MSVIALFSKDLIDPHPTYLAFDAGLAGDRLDCCAVLVDDGPCSLHLYSENALHP